MTERELFYAIAGTDEKWLEQAESTKKISSRKKKAAAVSAFAVCAAACAAVFLIKGGTTGKTPVNVPVPGGSAQNELTQDGEAGGEMTKAPDEHPVNRETTPPSVTPPQEAGSQESVTDLPVNGGTPDGDASGGSYGGFCIPALLPSAMQTIAVTGEKITDEEARVYFEENLGFIVAGLSASGVAADGCRVSEKGYCHLSFNGIEGETLTVKENFRDYLVYSGERLVSVVTLIKENGVITDSPAFGAPWFDTYASYLAAHAGQELLFVYALNAELVLAPDDSIYSPQLSPYGYDASAYLEGIQDVYSRLFHASAAYIP